MIFDSFMIQGALEGYAADSTPALQGSNAQDGELV